MWKGLDLMTAGRTNNNALSQNWCTPSKYVDAIRDLFDGEIHLDPCSNKYSIVSAKVEYTLPEIDGLKVSWNFPTVFVNPPYGRDKVTKTSIKDWLRKCHESHEIHKAEVLALVPVATNTSHWKKYVFGTAAAVSFLYDTRLKFLVNGKNGGKGAPMSCAMVYWGRRYEQFENIFIRFGAVVDLRHLYNKTIGIDEHITQTEQELGI